MKSQSMASKMLSTIVVIVSIAFMGILINWGKSVTDDAIISSTIDEMQQIGLQAEIQFEDNLEQDHGALSLLAEYIVRYDVDEDSIAEFLDYQSQTDEFDAVYYIGLDGEGISSKNTTSDFSDNDAFLYALENDYFVSEPTLSSDNSAILFDISIPIIKNGEVIAVLLAQTSIDNFVESIDKDLRNACDIFVVDNNLNLLISTNEEHIGIDTISENDINTMGVENVSDAASDIYSGISGGFHYDHFGIDKVMVYYPIAMTKWTLAMNAQVESLSNGLMIASKQFEIISDAVYWLVIFLVIYVSYKQHQSRKQLVKAAYFDPLTQLPNVTKFKLDVTSVLEKNKMNSYSMLIFDIDNFKAINQMFGYELGDRVLKSVKLFAESLNEPTLIAGRVGDDKFAMFAQRPFLDDVDSLGMSIHNFYDSVLPELTDYAGSFKVGRYNIPLGETNVDEIFSRVHLALARVKSSKGEAFCDYDDIFEENLRREAQITNNQKTALLNEEFKVFLQPKFSTSDDKLVGAEALVRWIKPDGSMVFPNDFIPLFETNGFIVELDRYILESVCKTLRHWIDNGFGALTISVNCSRLNLHNPFFLDGIIAIADKYLVPHEYIEIELTESATIEGDYEIEQLFTELHNNGFKISIDDFGAGYSSLAMLKNLHVDTLKMDRSFFVGGKNARRDDMLIDSIVKMSHNLGMYVVAEGIESVEQVEMLRSMNCDAVQGYVHAKPMPIPEFENKYRDILLQQVSTDIMPLISNINDAKYANTFVPCGIVIVKANEHFTIAEANDRYFDILGFSREEVRNIYNNTSTNLIHPDDRDIIAKLFADKIQNNPDAKIEHVCRVVTKQSGYITVQLSGGMAISEMGQPRLYFSIVDINSYVEMNDNLQKERSFNSIIASLTNSVFFDYDVDSDTIRFSRDFADKLNIPYTIEKFIDSEIGQTLFPAFINLIQKSYASAPSSAVLDGEFCITLSTGELAWYIFSCQTIFNDSKSGYRTVGKLSEAQAHKLEMDILKIKSESYPSTNIYDKHATDRYIHNYLRISTPENNTGAFYVVELSNWEKIFSTFDDDFARGCLRDVGDILRAMFRSSDIIGRIDMDRFYVFIGNYKTLDFVEKKALELCESLSKRYQKDNVSIDVKATVGIALYPESGDDFDALYEKAVLALSDAKASNNSSYAIYNEA